MLPCGTLDPHTACHQPVNLRTVHGNPLVFQIVQNIPVCGLVRQCADGTGLEGFSGTEQHFRKLMGISLYVAGEVQVNIRGFVSLEAQEGFKRNIVSVPFQRGAAFRAVFLRQVEPGTDFPAFQKLIPLALGAAVVGRQRIDSGDPCHSGGKGGAHRPTGTHLIPFGLTVFHQLPGNDVHDGKPVGNDGVQFSFQSGGNHLRQRIPVQFLGQIPAFGGQLFFGAVNVGRIVSFRNGPHILDPVGHQIRVGDDHFSGQLFSQIVKFRQHFLRGTVVQEGFLVGVLELHPGQNDPAVHLVFRVQVMGVAGGADRLSGFSCNLDHTAVQVFQFFLILHHPLFDHETVVGDGLDFQIIVKLRHFHKVGFRTAFPDGGKQFPGFTGRTDDEPFPEFFQMGAGDSRVPAIIFQIPVGHQRIQILHPGLIFHQDNQMVGFQFQRVGLFAHGVIHQTDV